jgi:hypothetical protein
MLSLFLYLFSEHFVAGGQPDDDRIYIENRVERAPDYTETGESL